MEYRTRQSLNWDSHAYMGAEDNFNTFSTDFSNKEIIFWDGLCNIEWTHFPIGSYSSNMALCLTDLQCKFLLTINRSTEQPVWWSQYILQGHYFNYLYFIIWSRDQNYIIGEKREKVTCIGFPTHDKLGL